MSEVRVDGRPALLDVFNEGVNQAMALHLFSDKKDAIAADFSRMTDAEFLEVVLSAERRPLNPITVAREALGYPEEATTQDIMDGLRDAYAQLLKEYETHGVDGPTALRASADIITHTEAYISGYSRKLGILAAKLVVDNPRCNAMQRWNDKVWVPDEDGHDRVDSFVMLATGIIDAEKFYTDHAHHMRVGVHVSTDELTTSSIYIWGQEGLTGPPYQNDAVLKGPVLGRVVKPVGSQEALHYRAYRVVNVRLVQEYPNETIVAFEQEHDEFEMPGREGIPDFDNESKIMSVAGVLDVTNVIRIQRTCINQLNVADAQLTTDAAKIARDKLLDPDGKYGENQLAKKQRQMELLRQRAVDLAIKKGELLPAIIGLTVEADPVSGELSFPMSA